MSKRKNETNAQYSQRMAAYQKARRAGSNPATETREATGPRRVSAWRLRYMLAADERRVAAVDRRRAEAADAVAAPRCFGDLRRLEFENAGKVGADKFGGHDRAAEDE